MVKKLQMQQLMIEDLPCVCTPLNCCRYLIRANNYFTQRKTDQYQ